jgi:integrase
MKPRAEIHDLRHAFSAWLGVGYELRAVLLAHKLPGKTADYTHDGPERDRQLGATVNTLDASFAQLIATTICSRVFTGRG